MVVRNAPKRGVNQPCAFENSGTVIEPEEAPDKFATPSCLGKRLDKSSCIAPFDKNNCKPLCIFINLLIMPKYQGVLFLHRRYHKLHKLSLLSL